MQSTEIVACIPSSHTKPLRSIQTMVDFKLGWPAKGFGRARGFDVHGILGEIETVQIETLRTKVYFKMCQKVVFP